MKKGGFENVIPTGHTEGKINGGAFSKIRF